MNPLTSRTVDGATVPLDSVVQWGPADALELASELGAGHVAGVTMPVTVLARSMQGARALRVMGTMASLFETLARHPDVTPPAFRKGVHYFDSATSYARAGRRRRSSAEKENGPAGETLSRG